MSKHAFLLKLLKISSRCISLPSRNYKPFGITATHISSSTPPPSTNCPATRSFCTKHSSASLMSQNNRRSGADSIVNNGGQRKRAAVSKSAFERSPSGKIARKMKLLESISVLDTPVKSESDKKSYRVIQLPNGLRALLVSDPSAIPPKDDNETAAANGDNDDDAADESDGSESDDGDVSDDNDDASEDGDAKEKLAACSLCIDVGSFSDPRDIQGLAHFLEHMIFMGSAKYPNENEFDQYIKRCGGSDNAHTGCEETQFYFEAGEEHLDGAMDRFASLFREPLMHREAMTREREAVESEFTSKRTNDGCRREQLLASLGRSQHPCSIFTWGNLRTLRDNVPGGDAVLYERVHEFRRRHYSAHRMYVAVQARMPLDVLQELVVRHWSDMPTNGLAGDDFAVAEMGGGDSRQAFGDEFGERMFVVRPVANVRRLELTFCLPSLLAQYRGKPHYFVAYLLGHEGEGSLCAYLRKKLYALDLTAGVDEPGFENNTLYSLFVVSIHLTAHGLANVRHVYAAVLAYVRHMQTADGAQLERLFREVQTIEENSFRFRNDQSPMDNVEEFAANLKYYPPELLFTGDTLYLDYEPQQIADVLDAMNDPRTPVNVMLTTRTMPAELAGQQFDRREQWFGTEYAHVEFPAGWRELRTDPGPGFGSFALPPPNQYITTDFGILYEAGVSKPLAEHPQKLLESPVAELWHRQDGRFLLPVAYYYFYLQSPVFRGSAKNCVLAAMLPMLLKFRVIERLYPATIAGLGYDCYTSDKGLVLRVSGYNQQLHRIVETFGVALREFTDELTQDQFQTFVEQKLRDYYNVLIKPKSFAKIMRLNLIEHEFVPTLEKFECLKTVELADFRSFMNEMLGQLRIQALMQGNIGADEATAIMQRFSARLRTAPIADRSRLELRANRLPPATASKSAHYLRYRNLNASDANTVTVSYYQLGPISIRLNCLLDLLLLIAEEPVFDELRSKEQLGYGVGCSVRDNFGVLGYSVTVESQETKHTAEHCDRRIEVFRTEWLAEHVAKMSDVEFGKFRETLIRLKLTDDNDLRDEMTRNWAEVTSEEYMFGRHQREVECLRTIEQSEFVEFYAKHCAEAETRKLCVQIIGNSQVATTNADGGDEGGDEEAEVKEATIPEPDSIFETSFKRPETVEFEQAPLGAQLIGDVEQFRSALEVFPVCKTTDLSE